MLQIHVSAPGRIGKYIPIDVQVDTDNLSTYHLFGFWDTYDVINFIFFFFNNFAMQIFQFHK